MTNCNDTDLDAGRIRPRAAHASRSRWAALGAAVAVTLGAGGGFGLAQAVQGSGTRATYVPISPCRLTDTRADNRIGPRGTPLGPDETYTISARGASGLCRAEQLPVDATALVLNVTALGATSQSYLTFWPAGERPEAASLNPSVGAPPTPNAVTTALGPDGTFEVYNERGEVNVVIDVAGYYVDHHHDDRYYTKQEADAAFGAGSGDVDDGYSQSEVDAAIVRATDDLLETITGPNGPTKANGAAIQDIEDHLERSSTVAVDRLAFHPIRPGGDRDVDAGVFIPSGSSNRELWAAVEIPFGAIVTGVRARLVDDTGGASLGVDLYEVAPSGVRVLIAGQISTVGATNSPSARTFAADALFTNDDVDVTYEVRVSVNQGVVWNDANIGKDLQLVSFFVDYEHAVLEQN